MRYASIQTTMNIYEKAMREGERQAHSKVVAMILNRSKSKETVGRNNPAAAIYWELTEVFWCASNPCTRLLELVAGEGFEPSTFGL